MKKIKIMLFLLMFSMVSCSAQSFVFNDNYRMAKRVSYSDKKIFINWGINDEQVLYNPSSYCSKGEVLAKIEFKQKRGYLLELLTLGYLQTRVIDIYCLDPKQLQ